MYHPEASLATPPVQPNIQLQTRCCNTCNCTPTFTCLQTPLTPQPQTPAAAHPQLQWLHPRQALLSKCKLLKASCGSPNPTLPQTHLQAKHARHVLGHPYQSQRICAGPALYVWPPCLAPARPCCAPALLRLLLLLLLAGAGCGAASFRPC